MVGRETAPGKWSSTRTATVHDYSRALIGNYQEQIHQDSRGFLWRVNVEVNQGTYYIKLYSNRATVAEIDLGFSTGVTFALISQTTIANGYVSDGLSNLMEFSSVLHGRKIYVLFKHQDSVTNYGNCVELLMFDMAGGATSCQRLNVYLSDSFGVNTNYTSVDIDCMRHRGRAFLWCCFIEYFQTNLKYNWFMQPIPIEPSSRYSWISCIRTELEGVDNTGVLQFQALKYCTGDEKIFSITNGLINCQATLPAGMSNPAPGTPAQYENYNGWECFDDEQQLITVAGGGQQPLGEVPIGGYVYYDLNPATIPANFHICDGTGGTPDLRGLFIKTVAGGGSVGDSGGATTHKHNADGTLATDTYNLNVNTGVPSATAGPLGDMGNPTMVADATHTHPVSDSHSHDVTGDTNTVDGQPPYYSLYIIRRMS